MRNENSNFTSRTITKKEGPLVSGTQVTKHDIKQVTGIIKTVLQQTKKRRLFDMWEACIIETSK